MSGEGSNPGPRLRGTVISKPIVYGNVARYFGKKREEDGHTHQWTVFLRPLDNEDMSTYVRKVIFKLHESYTSPNRVITRPPYEVTETGWGEFDLQIKVVFQDTSEKALIIYHHLKLFHSDTEVMLGRKNLVSEFYDEMVIIDPTPLFYRQLNTARPITSGPWQHETDFDAVKTETLNSILSAKRQVSEEIHILKENLKKRQEVVTEMRAIMDRLESQTLNN